MRCSRLDSLDPAGQRRRHFEIAIDTPITLVNCRAIQASTSLPEYSGITGSSPASCHTTCGCPDAEFIMTDDMSPLSRPATSQNTSASDGELSLPHSSIPISIPISTTTSRRNSFDTNTPQNLEQEGRRPNLLGELVTPPPGYETVMGAAVAPGYNTAIGEDGLADYFARLADHMEDMENTEDYFSPKQSTRVRES
jgi:hypothetical protein